MTNLRITCAIEGCNSRVKAFGFCYAHYVRLRRHGDAMAGGRPRGLSVGSPLRYLQDVALPYAGDDCLIWPFAQRSKGYATAWIDGVQISIPRYVCERVHGPPPSPSHHAAHSCGRGHLGCIASPHLRWATAKENSDDKIEHGTTAIGQRNGQAKLTDIQVREIRQMWPAMTQKAIADRYGVSASTIGTIVRGERWSWLK